ncbi:MAG: hypothetical protein H7A46_06710 [Verrucomicrobiales bacterium]|nr:hypothetical protein [Verrucomicrobiales bacterium]
MKTTTRACRRRSSRNRNSTAVRTAGRGHVNPVDYGYHARQRRNDSPAQGNAWEPGPNQPATP